MKLLQLLPLVAFAVSMPMTIAGSDGPGWFADSDGWQGYEVAFALPVVFCLIGDPVGLLLGFILAPGSVAVVLYLSLQLYVTGFIRNSRDSHTAVLCIGVAGLAGMVFGFATFAPVIFLCICLVACAVSLFLYVGRILFENQHYRGVVLIPASLGIFSTILVLQCSPNLGSILDSSFGPVP